MRKERSQPEMSRQHRTCCNECPECGSAHIEQSHGIVVQQRPSGWAAARIVLKIFRRQGNNLTVERGATKVRMCVKCRFCGPKSFFASQSLLNLAGTQKKCKPGILRIPCRDGGGFAVIIRRSLAG